MRRALELAARGVGSVEPNPAVGCVVVADDASLIGEGWHERFGGPHAEINALAQAGEQARGATLYVTLEPCCHFGKTPPCSRAVIAAGVRRVVVGTQDPAAHVAGGGIAELRAAGIQVEVGLLQQEARNLIAPFAKLHLRGLPFVHAKWAMSLDGKIATRTGHSQWISNEASRRVVHELRGRMDAVMVGIGTALADDPQLTARPPGPRTACRIVVDTHARLPLGSKLVTTARDTPVLLAVGPSAADGRIDALAETGVEVLRLPAAEMAETTGTTGIVGGVDVDALLAEMGRRRMTNVLVEGGGRLLGSLFDRQAIDEVHVFMAAKLIGGRDAPSPLAGTGLSTVPHVAQIRSPQIAVLDGDVYIHGRIESSPVTL
jgi:diaminohydroxyphosphoribosylaminopyrimidine deaminase/5-amino-6-(5-phosphoribosylamino)uracil reductase